MTEHDHAPYRPRDQLLDFRRYFGPEQRDILMFWRNRPKIHFAEHHAREPGGLEMIATDLYCQHYGKSLSLDHWEETCDYYIKHFPFETYGRNGPSAKARASTPSPISSARSMNGATSSSPMRSRSSARDRSQIIGVKIERSASSARIRPAARRRSMPSLEKSRKPY